MPFFKLFILMAVMAVQRNNALYLASVSHAGNQIRLGGHEAPPRIISSFLGQTLTAIVEGTERPVRKNLKDTVFNLTEDVIQEDTDRNRTSPYAFTGNRFEFRALGSAQNAAFPMAVIAATMANEIQIVDKKLKDGAKLDDVIAELVQATAAVRFEGNGYSK